MKRFSLFLMSLLFIGLGMFAQKNLNISKVFGGKYVTDPQVSETVTVSYTHLQLVFFATRFKDSDDTAHK